MHISPYSEVISAAGSAGINLIPLIWTLTNGGQSFSGTVEPRINAVKTVSASYRANLKYFSTSALQAVIKNPDPVLAVAMGDEVHFSAHYSEAVGSHP